MNLLLHNTLIFTNDTPSTVLSNHAVVIQGNQIIEIGQEADLIKKYKQYSRIDGKGRLLMPGLINAHMHCYSTFARGLTIKERPRRFGEILSMLWWKLDWALDEDAIYYSTLIPAITAIKKGVTSFIDHHSSPHAIADSLDHVERAMLLLGLRGVLCYEVSNRDGAPIAWKGLAENERYLRKCQRAQEKDSCYLMDGMVGLHASFTLENETLAAAGAMSVQHGKGCHIHVGEAPLDQQITFQNHQCGLVERLDQFGILGPQTIAAHGIHLTEPEKDLLAQKDTILVHNPQSNMNNAVGRTDIFSYLQKNILLGLGTDGMCADIKPDVRTALWLQKHDLHDSNAGWQELEQVVLHNNPAIMERITGTKLGKIKAGYLADLILVDYYPPTPLTADNFWGHFLFGICDADVDTSIINGQVVMENKQLVGIDEEKAAVASQRCAERVWSKF
ncbi:MAG: putative aminohydrolase SsnA [SAR324 cluster bacterium]|nr:putative aminohydrolase SsnA [SAR324 cluster bacterium]